MGGCRSELDSLAVKIRDKGYIVFNIDYRLSCSANLWICGFTFSVPPNDAKTAIHWARNHISNNGRLVAIGTSGGGNLFFDANNQGITGDTRPDVVASASGPAELGYMSDGNPACDESYPTDLSDCWPHTQLFEGKAFVSNSQHTPCSDNWADGSPACNIPSSGVKPTFIANASKEATPWLEAEDFYTDLNTNFTATLCTVSASAWKHYHGTQLLLSSVKCDGRTDSVFDYMMSWIATH